MQAPKDRFQNSPADYQKRCDVRVCRAMPVKADPQARYPSPSLIELIPHMFPRREHLPESFCLSTPSNPYSTISFPMVVLSPPGIIIPSISSRCLGSRTGIPVTSTPNIEAAKTSAFRCASKSPCNANTPMRSVWLDIFANPTLNIHNGIVIRRGLILLHPVGNTQI